MKKGISVITPTEGRPHLVKRLLFSLQKARENFQGEVEIIIIDSSEGPVAEEIQKTCLAHNALYLRGTKSVREKRNLGIKQAKFEIILCIDSDCEADKDLLNQHFSTYERYPFVGGCAGVTLFRGERSWVWKILELTPFLDSFSFAAKYPYLMWAPCSNFSFKKSVIKNIGGFRTDWPFNLGGDDLDLTLRMTEKGFLIKGNKDAIVFHTTETWNKLGAVVERIWRWGRMSFHVAQAHPRLLYHDIPRFPIVFIFMVVIGLLFSLKQFFTGLAIPTIGLLSFWVFYAVVSRVLRNSSSPLLYVIISRIFITIYEFGQVYESIKHKSVIMLFKRLTFSEDEIINEWGSEITYTWTLILTMVTLLVFIAYMV